MSVWILTLGWSLGCGSLSAPMEELEMAGEARHEPAAPGVAYDEVLEEKAEAQDRGMPKRARLKEGAAGVLLDALGNASPDAAPEEAEEDTDSATSGSSSDRAEATRTWFPEAFLWQPRVQTGESGQATLDVRVPDQLTTWRVLALAHDRRGQQAGTVHTFDSRLPVYVEPVVPGWLVAGDQLQLPVQAVNSTADAVTATLQVQASGAMRGFGRSTLRLGSGASDVRYIPLQVTGAGEATLRAELRSDQARDAAQRIVPIHPSGRPVVHTFGSTLASSRAFEVQGATGADPTTEELSISIFPGPLAVLQAEVERLEAGATPANPGYGFALATQLGTVGGRLGIEIDEARQRRLSIVAWQRLVGLSRAPDAAQAGELLTVLRSVEGHELVDRVRPRLERVLVEGQRADGTWSRVAASTLQRVLVETAVAARALPERETGARLRAMGAVERHARDVSDPYTAAVLLASGLAQGPPAEHFRTLLDEALTEGPSGAQTLAVPAGVVNPAGSIPRRPEVLAWAVLALPHDHPARGDLASELMGGWSATRGFGAGHGDLVALEAVLEALPGATEPVQIVLSRGAVELARGRLDPAQPRQPLVLEARPGNGALTLTATPAVPGLAFVATRRSWVPWSRQDTGIDGVEVEVSARGLVRGREGTLRIVASAPSGTRLRIEQGLPAGAQVTGHPSGLQTGARVESVPGSVQVSTGAFEPGEVKEIELTIVPAFAGRFRTAPLVVAVEGGREVALEPLTWSVRAP